jgi:hypothetical protein
VLIKPYATVTSKPPSDEKACVKPSTFSRCRGLGKSSASQATAATNSTHTPMNVVQRKNSSHSGVVLKPAAKAENA